MIAGDPTLRGLALPNMTWTVALDDEFSVTAVPVRGATPTWSYVIHEADRYLTTPPAPVSSGLLCLRLKCSSSTGFLESFDTYGNTLNQLEDDLAV